MRIEEEIRPSVINMLKVNMGFKSGEKLLVLADYPEAKHWREYSVEDVEDVVKRCMLARRVYDVAREEYASSKVDFYPYPLTGRHGAEPPGDVGREMKRYDVVIAITTFSLTHTRARENATKTGTRIASMPGFTVEMLMPDGPMSADYKWISDFSRRILERVKDAKRIRVVSDAGTDVEFNVENRVWGVDDGIYDKPGSWGNLPAGEVYVPPIEGSGKGRVVVEKGWYPKLEEPMILRFEKGEVVDVEGGGKVGSHLRELLGLTSNRSKYERYRARRNLAEFGIGTNPKARNPLNILEAEKILGTVHVAIGDNKHLGGVVEADLHEDFVIPNPTVYFDGKILIDRGKTIIR